MAKCEVYGNACHLLLPPGQLRTPARGASGFQPRPTGYPINGDGIGHLLVEALPPCLLLSMWSNALEKVWRHRTKAFQHLQS